MTVNIEWGLGSGAPDPGAMVQQGYELGQKQRDQTNLRRALGILSADPTDPAARATAMALDPQILGSIDNAAWARQAHQQAEDYRSGLRDRLLAGMAPAGAAPAATDPSARPQPSGAMAALLGGPAPHPQPIPDGSEFGRVDVAAPVAPAPPGVSVGGTSPTLAALLGPGAGLSGVAAPPVASAPTLPDLPAATVAAAQPAPAPAPAPDAQSARDAAFARMVKADPERAAALMETERAQRVAQRTAQLEFAEKVNAHGLQLLATAHDQPSYDAAVASYNAMLTANGLPAANLPPTYSAETVHGLQLQALDVKEQIAAAKDAATLAETIRNHKATEGASKFKAFAVKPGEVMHVVDESTGALDTPDSGEGTGTPAGVPSSGAPASSSSPRSVRNNNPGNLRASGWTQKQAGYVGKDAAGYARFDSPESGQAAQATLLRGNGYMAGGRNTVQTIIEKWAPRASVGGDNTDTQVNNYIGYVARQLGVKPGQPLSPEQAPQLAAAMARFESGATGKAGTVRVGASASPAPAPAAGHGWPIMGPPAAKETLSPAEINFFAQDVANGGDMPQLGMGKEAAHARQAILARVAQIRTGQGGDGTDYGTRRAESKAAKQALQTLERQAAPVLAFERTAKMNGDVALSLASANGNGQVPIFNRWVNAGKTAVTGDPDVTRFHAAVETFANEFAKLTSSATGGGVTSDSSRQHVYDMINRDQSPAQFRGTMQVLYRDMENRRVGLAQQRQELLKTIQGGPARQAPASGGGGGNVPTLTPDQVRAAPSGTVFRTTDGRTMRKR